MEKSFLILGFWIGYCWCGYLSSEHRLLEHLLKNNNKLVRPVVDPKQSVEATFGVELVQIIEVNDRAQLITTKVWVRQAWLNQLMSWNSSLWYGIETLHVDYTDVWTPDVVLYDSAEEDLAGGKERFKTQITLHSNGLHEWFSPAVFVSTCNIKIENFPFDRQVCSMKFGSWAHNAKGINLTADNRRVVTSTYIESSEWELTKVEKQLNNVLYSCCSEPYPDVTFKLHLKRKSSFYVFNVIVPCLVIALTILFGFFFPPESGERVSLTITILLAMAVFMQIISGTLPVNSDHTPKLSLFYMVILIESATSLAATCIVLTFHYRGDESNPYPMPRCVRRFFVEILGRKFGCVREAEEIRRVKSSEKVNKGCERENGSHNRVSVRSRGWKGGKRRNPYVTAVSFPAIREIQKDVHKLLNDLKEGQENEETNHDWKILAKVLDRMFFVIFLLTLAVSSVSILVPAYLHSL